MAGMAGRIVVGGPADAGWDAPPRESGDLPPEVLAVLPAVPEILARGRITQEDRA